MKQIIEKLSNEDGYTLLEMAIVVLIITALLLLVIMNVDGVKNTVDEKTSKGVITTVETQMVLYEMNESESLPADTDSMLQELVDKDYISNEQKEAYKNSKQP